MKESEPWHADAPTAAPNDELRELSAPHIFGPKASSLNLTDMLLTSSDQCRPTEAAINILHAAWRAVSTGSSDHGPNAWRHRLHIRVLRPDVYLTKSTGRILESAVTLSREDEGRLRIQTRMTKPE